MDAYEHDSKAFGDYYRAVRQLGPNPTPQQKAELEAKIIAPAKQEFSNAIATQVSDTDHHIRQAVFNKLKSTFLGLVIPKWVLDPKAAGSKGKGAKGGTTAVSATAPAPTPTYHREETVLDGSKVPKEIEFSGPSKAAAPKPSKPAGP